MNLKDVALSYAAAGLRIIPNHTRRGDGSCSCGKPTCSSAGKHPRLSSWQNAATTDTETISAWWTQWPDASIGIACGNGVEGLDFDNHPPPDVETLVDEWKRTVDALLPGITNRLVIERTQNGGYHLWYRCHGVNEGNTKLARRPPVAGETEQCITLIETRGRGGQFAVSPSPGYTLIQGDFTALPTITQSEREILLSCARALNTYIKPQNVVTPEQSRQAKKKTRASGDRAPMPGDNQRPGDDFDTRGAEVALNLLLSHQWKIAYRRNNALFLTRPGKAGGISATFGFVAPGVLYVFSSNAAPFEPERAYSPFAIYATLEHRGDFRLAARALAEKGYGSQSYGGGHPYDYPYAHQGCPEPSGHLPSTGQSTNGSTSPLNYSENNHGSLPNGMGAVQPAVEQLLNNHQNNQPPLPNRFKGDELMTARALRDMPDPEWMIDHLLPTNDLVTVYGASGAGKSFFLLDIALCVAQKAPVVYVAAEALASYKPRVAAWREHHHADEGHLYFWKEAVNLMDPIAVRQFVSQLLPVRPAVVILDTLARCMVGGDENSSKDMGIAIAACDYIRGQLGCSIVLAHHTGKSGTSERGSSALRGACATMIELLNNGDGVITVRCDKLRLARPLPPRYFQLVEKDTGLLDADQQPITSAVLIPTTKITHRYDGALNQRERDILDVLAMPAMAGEARNKDIAEMLQIEPNRVTYAMNKLLAQGYVEFEKKGREKPFQLTDKGWRLVREEAAAASSPPPESSNEDLNHFNWCVKNCSPTIPLGSEEASYSHGKESNSSCLFKDSSTTVQQPFNSSIQSLPPIGGERLKNEQEQSEGTGRNRVGSLDIVREGRTWSVRWSGKGYAIALQTGIASEQEAWGQAHNFVTEMNAPHLGA